ncbi:MAG: hypothetical protein HY360_13370, partial [Verrucomicrobia bacterium]|nr:hypothetical protein [Verrucomicrobiota bacterium]
LDAEWRPVGEPKPLPNAPAVSVWEGVHSSLYVVLGEFAPSADAKQVASKIARFKPDASGELGIPAFVSERFEGKTIPSMTVDEGTGVIYATMYPLP